MRQGSYFLFYPASFAAANPVSCDLVMTVLDLHTFDSKPLSAIFVLNRDVHSNVMPHNYKLHVLEWQLKFVGELLRTSRIFEILFIL